MMKILKEMSFCKFEFYILVLRPDNVESPKKKLNLICYHQGLFSLFNLNCSLQFISILNFKSADAFTDVFNKFFLT